MPQVRTVQLRSRRVCRNAPPQEVRAGTGDQSELRVLTVELLLRSIKPPSSDKPV